MSDEQRVLSWRCPNGHDVLSTFDVEQLRADLVRGAASASCSECGQSHTFSPEAQAEITRWLESDSDQETCALCGKTLGDDEGGDVQLSTLSDADRATAMKHLSPDGGAQPDTIFAVLCDECFAKQ